MKNWQRILTVGFTPFMLLSHPSLLKTNKMARQKGIIKIDGTLGDITFTQTQDGHIARLKTSLNGDKIATSPSFQRTRENIAEFGNAGRATKLMRDAIRTVLQYAKDNRVTSRLTKEMMRVVKADPLSERGKRDVLHLGIETLQGFNFNKDSVLESVYFGNYMPFVDKATGQGEITVASFIPSNSIVAPQGATHFKLVSCGAEIDFANGRYMQNSTASDEFPIDATATPVLTMSTSFTPNTASPVFLLFGIQFFQRVNDVNYQLKNGSYNALSLIKVVA